MSSYISHPFIECCVTASVYPGEKVSGDYAFFFTENEKILIGIMDGLGHGVLAHHAVITAMAILEKNVNKSPDIILKLCHEGLINTNGMAISMASIDIPSQVMTWAGIGNVAGLLVHAAQNPPSREHLLLRNGVIGYRLPPLKLRSDQVFEGDLIIFCSDGIKSGYSESLNPLDPIQRIADRIFSYSMSAEDDATVLTARIRRKN